MIAFIIVISLCCGSALGYFRCNEFEGFGEFRHPADCSLFVMCREDGSQVPVRCPSGRRWRVTGLGKGHCDLAENTICEGEYSYPYDKGSMLIFHCPQNEIGKFIDGYYGNDLNCNQYFMCLDGTHYDMACPKGLKWCNTKLQCDYEYRANCTEVMKIQHGGMYDPKDLAEVTSTKRPQTKPVTTAHVQEHHVTENEIEGSGDEELITLDKKHRSLRDLLKRR